MNTNRLTIRILLGMLAGCAAGLLLMRFFPVGIQPGDRLEARLRDGTTLTLEVAGSSRPEKTLEVLTQSGERGKAWLEKETSVLASSSTYVFLGSYLCKLWSHQLGSFYV
jgi:hypothetical protein